MDNLSPLVTKLKDIQLDLETHWMKTKRGDMSDILDKLRTLIENIEESECVSQPTYDQKTTHNSMLRNDHATNIFLFQYHKHINMNKR